MAFIIVYTFISNVLFLNLILILIGGVLLALFKENLNSKNLSLKSIELFKKASM